MENKQTECEVEFDVGDSFEKTLEEVCQLINASMHSLLVAKIDRIYLFIGIFNSVLNPFIYAFWNPEFKTQLLELITSATPACCSSVGNRDKEDIQQPGTDTAGVHNLAVSSV